MSNGDRLELVVTARPTEMEYLRSTGVAASTSDLVGRALGLPFDTARAMHAAAARSGLIQRSILESRDFEHTLTALEQFTLGPWARHV